MSLVWEADTNTRQGREERELKGTCWPLMGSLDFRSLDLDFIIHVIEVHPQDFQQRKSYDLNLWGARTLFLNGVQPFLELNWISSTLLILAIRPWPNSFTKNRPAESSLHLADLSPACVTWNSGLPPYHGKVVGDGWGAFWFHEFHAWACDLKPLKWS